MNLFTKKTENLTTCSFCGKLHTEVQKLIAGPGVYICDSCVNVCKGILAKEFSGGRNRSNKLLNAKEIKDRLDLLRELRDDKIITEKDFSARAKRLAEQL